MRYGQGRIAFADRMGKAGTEIVSGNRTVGANCIRQHKVARETESGRKNENEKQNENEFFGQTLTRVYPIKQAYSVPLQSDILLHTMSSIPAIAFEGVTKQFGSFTAVNDLSFEVPQGSIFGFLGPNGSGKSTSLRMMMDLIRPTSGDIRLFGQSMTSHSIKD